LVGEIEIDESWKAEDVKVEENNLVKAARKMLIRVQREENMDENGCGK